MRGIASLYGKTGDGKKEPGQFFNYVSLCFLLIMPFIILNMELFGIPWWHGATGFITKQQPRQPRRGKSGIRPVHSIQTEGHFGDIKENESFRRFNYRSEEKVYKEFMLYAIGRNIMKHRFLHHEIETYEGKKEQTIP